MSENKQGLNISFLGDVCSIGGFDPLLKEKRAIFSPELSEILSMQDFVIANLEGPVTDKAAINNPYKRIASSTDLIPYLIDQNIRCFNLANNHTMDCGVEGLEDSINEIQKLNGICFGAGLNTEEASKPVILERNGVKVAIFSSTVLDDFSAKKSKAGTCQFNSAKETISQAEKLKQQADYVLYCYHGDAEFVPYPLPAKRKFFKQLCGGPIDVIIGHHPHVIQGMELIKETKVFYSLGNFMFNSDRQKRFSFTEFGLLLEMHFTKEKINYSYSPVRLDRQEMSLNIDANRFDFESLCDFENYDRHWIKQASRVFREDKMNAKALSASDYIIDETKNTTSAVEGAKSSKLLRWSFYKTLYKAWMNPHYRPILIAFLKEKIKKA